MNALLALEDGTYFEGTGFGAGGEAFGEVVFNTSMTGYQEILTDPSYKGQIVTMTYPLIGNYGINPDDVESVRPQVEGFVVRENSRTFSNWRAQESLETYLKQHNIVGIEGVDTRALTRHIREGGAMKGVISTIDLDPNRLVKKAKDSPGLIGRDLVKEVTGDKEFKWMRGTGPETTQTETGKPRVVVFDFGVKQNILRRLFDYGCHITVVPAKTTAERALYHNPDGIVFSPGPGDPEGVPYAIETVRKLIGKKPIFGICLGHQLLALAMGGKTYKLKFGHHGGNQPVKNLLNGRVEITAQNHGFAVDMNSLNKEEIELTHLNLNDQTTEGMRHRKLPILSIQYHPEASPGPHDADYLFRQFIQTIKNGKTA